MGSTKGVRTSTRARRRWQNELRSERRIERGFGIKRDAEVPEVLRGLVGQEKPEEKGSDSTEQ